jgi:hypothetical protein
MRAFDSSIGRLLIVVMNVAIGMEAMRSQSEFWLGVLAALTVLWLIHALATAATERGPRRVFCLVFASSALAFLAVFSGPWSDASFRGDVTEPDYDQRIARDALPPTRALLRFAARQVKPMARGRIDLVDQSGRTSIEIVLSQRPGRYLDLGQLTDDLDVAARVHMGIFSERQRGYPTQTRTRFHTLDVYFHAAYLLLSLAFGALVGCVVLLLLRLPRRAEPS